MGRPVLTLSVKNFGPIREGSVKLRPLTILIGPNNAGKSYLATLAYAFWNAFDRPAVFDRSIFWWRMGRERLAGSEQRNIFDDASIFRTFGQLPEGDRKQLEKFVSRLVRRMADALAEELQRCFGTDLMDLTRAGAAEPLSLVIEQDHPPVNLEFVAADHRLRLRAKAWDFSSLPIGGQPGSDQGEVAPIPFLQYALVRGLFPFISSTAYYLPAARSGILQGHKALASSLLSRLPLVGVERFDIPQLSGVAADFIGNLLQLVPRRPSRHISSAVDFLETQVCKGSLETTAAQPKLDYPEIYYRQQGPGKLPLHRTSSMVSEVAPIIVFLKYLINKNDFLILEEPEAHLHPDNQRLMARAVARLVRDGVRVLVTTHSDYFVQQVSNLVRMKETPELRKRLGYAEEESLAVEDLGAYLFCMDTAEGSVIEELRITAEEGIPEEEFIRIAEEIYDETTSLEHARLGQG